MNSPESPSNSSEQLSLYELHKKLDKINEEIAFSDGDTEQQLLDQKADLEKKINASPEAPMSRRDTAIKHISEQIEQANKNLEEFGSHDSDHDDGHLYELQDYVERLEYELEEIMKGNEQTISLYIEK